MGDTAKKELIPIKPLSDSAQIGTSTQNKPISVLNGYYVLYNGNRQKTKEGSFQENRLKDGKNYIYDAAGHLVRVELYKDFKYIGDTTNK